MPTAKLQEHLLNVTERLDIITVALLSDHSGTRKNLMAERRLLLADVVRTWNKLEKPAAKSHAVPTHHPSQDLQLVGKIGSSH